MKKTLIINGHPDKESLCFALAESYKKGADLAGTDCKLVNLIDLDFNPILTFGYRRISALEPDLLEMQQKILAAEHIENIILCENNDLNKIYFTKLPAIHPKQLDLPLRLWRQYL
jgi:Flavodoxin-like fold